MNKKSLIVCDEHIRFLETYKTHNNKTVNRFAVDISHKDRFCEMIDYHGRWNEQFCGLVGIVLSSQPFDSMYEFVVSKKIKFITPLSLKEARLKKLKRLNSTYYKIINFFSK